MTMFACLKTRRLGLIRRMSVAAGLFMAVSGGLTGCDALNPSFINILPISGDTSAFLSFDAPSGFIPILFQNNTTFDPEVITYVETANGEQIADQAGLRPRVRMTVQVNYVNGAQQILQFVDGSAVHQNVLNLCANSQGAGVTNPRPVDLDENDATNKVVACGIVAITVQTIEVYVPTSLKVLAVIINQVGFPVVVLDRIEAPHFQALLVDDQLVRNFDPMDAPPPVLNPTCGAAVAITLTGELSLPFNRDECGEVAAGYFNTDFLSEARIPGRYRVVVSLLGR